ncbi:hypothetical protein AAH991_00820 [Microbispora sp. ZYX-F-249]|uniref:Transposase n=1 Tax=Microbispora maris TaxID=3144104 RepID=A0ABV0AGI3_9ACTN
MVWNRGLPSVGEPARKHADNALPLLVAMVLVRRHETRGALKLLLKRVADRHTVPRFGWYVLAIRMPPGVTAIPTR